MKYSSRIRFTLFTDVKREFPARARFPHFADRYETGTRTVEFVFQFIDNLICTRTLNWLFHVWILVWHKSHSYFAVRNFSQRWFAS